MTNVTSPQFFEDNSRETAGGWDSSTGTTAAGWSPSDEPVGWSKYLVVSVQWIVFVVGAVGNLMVLVVLVWRRSHSQVGTQLFVGSLAVADIGLMLSTVWVTAYSALQKDWPFGVIPCKLKYAWQWLTMNCSIWTLVALSIDRYLCTLNYLKKLQVLRSIFPDTVYLPLGSARK